MSIKEIELNVLSKYMNGVSKYMVTDNKIWFVYDGLDWSTALSKKQTYTAEELINGLEQPYCYTKKIHLDKYING